MARCCKILSTKHREESTVVAVVSREVRTSGKKAQRGKVVWSVIHDDDTLFLFLLLSLLLLLPTDFSCYFSSSPHTHSKSSKSINRQASSCCYPTDQTKSILFCCLIIYTRSSHQSFNMHRDNLSVKVMMRETGSRVQRRLSPHMDVLKEQKIASAVAVYIEKSVRFNMAVVEETDCPPPLIVTSRSDVWYTNSDYQKMRNRERALTKELAKSFPNSNFAVDGVESLVYRRAKIDRVFRARECVLKLQTLPQDAFAKVYQNTGEASTKLALQKAETNYNEVYNNTSEGNESTDDISLGSSTPSSGPAAPSE